MDVWSILARLEHCQICPSEQELVKHLSNPLPVWKDLRTYLLHAWPGSQTELGMRLIGFQWGVCPPFWVHIWWVRYIEEKSSGKVCERVSVKWNVITCVSQYNAWDLRGWRSQVTDNAQALHTFSLFLVGGGRVGWGHARGANFCMLEVATLIVFEANFEMLSVLNRE